MKSFGIGTAVVALTVAIGSGPIYGQASQAAREDAQGFINDMTIAGLAEVQLGKMATERAANADVKAFGQMMVKDHSQANDELKQVASQLKVQPATQLDQKHKDLVDKFATLQGAEFNREYVNAMVQGHQEVLGKLRARADVKLPARGAGAGDHPAGHPGGAVSSTGSRGHETETSKPAAQNPGAGDTTGRGHGDETLTQWAAKTLPRVQQHLDRARELQQKVAK